MSISLSACSSISPMRRVRIRRPAGLRRCRRRRWSITRGGCGRRAGEWTRTCSTRRTRTTGVSRRGRCASRVRCRTSVWSGRWSGMSGSGCGVGRISSSCRRCGRCRAGRGVGRVVGCFFGRRRRFCIAMSVGWRVVIVGGCRSRCHDQSTAIVPLAMSDRVLLSPRLDRMSNVSTTMTLAHVEDIAGIFVAVCRCGWRSGECSWPTTAAGCLAEHLVDEHDPAHGAERL